MIKIPLYLIENEIIIPDDFINWIENGLNRDLLKADPKYHVSLSIEVYEGVGLSMVATFDNHHPPIEMLGILCFTIGTIVGQWIANNIKETV